MAKKKAEAEEEEKQAPEGEAAEGEGEEGGAKKGKKKLLFIVAGVVLLLVVIGVVLMLTMGGGSSGDKPKEPTPEEQKAAADAAKPVYYELPEFLVNLNSNNSRVSFLKMSVTLELKDQASVAVVEANKPRIMDVFNTYLRELRASDVQGSAGIYHLRDALMTRLNSTIQEGLVKDILFSEIIVQ